MMGATGDPVKVLVRKALYGLVKNAGKNVRVYPGHMSTICNPEYPCITLNKKGETREDGLGGDDKLYLSVWSKTGNDELWNIYNQVKALLDLKSIEGDESSGFHSILLAREIYTNDNLFERDTHTYQLATRYKINIL